MEHLNDTQFNALIKLLDDDDPEVSEHVWSRLTEMGKEGVERLEAAWETAPDPVTQDRLEEILHKIMLRDVADELKTWRMEGGIDLLEGWLKFTRYRYPHLEERSIRNEVSRLSHKTWLEINERMDPSEKLRVLNHVLFVMEKYQPNHEDSTDPKNNFFNFVTETHRGNPLSLGIMYMLVAQNLDLPVSGVLLPNYFVLLWKDAQYEFFIDVYNDGRFFTRKELQNFLRKIKVEEKPSFFKPTSNIYIVLSLIENLKNNYKKHGEMERVAELEELSKLIEVSF